MGDERGGRPVATAGCPRAGGDRGVAALFEACGRGVHRSDPSGWIPAATRGSRVPFDVAQEWAQTSEASGACDAGFAATASDLSNESPDLALEPPHVLAGAAHGKTSPFSQMGPSRGGHLPGLCLFARA